MNRILVALAFVITCLAWESSAQAMTCNNRLVAVGDAMARVRALCGEPDSVSERVVHRTRAVHRRVNGGIITDRISVAVTLVSWVYDFGPTRFMRELVFEENRLRTIDTLGYGTSRSSASERAVLHRVQIGRPLRSV